MLWPPSLTSMRPVNGKSVGYFERHAEAMNDPAFGERGWLIGSGMTEGGVKQFNKRVKGTEQFWSEQGVEPILALRSLWLSDDTRWRHYWRGHAPDQKAAWAVTHPRATACGVAQLPYACGFAYHSCLLQRPPVGVGMLTSVGTSVVCQPAGTAAMP